MLSATSSSLWQVHQATVGAAKAADTAEAAAAAAAAASFSAAAPLKPGVGAPQEGGTLAAWTKKEKESLLRSVMMYGAQGSGGDESLAWDGTSLLVWLTGGTTAIWPPRLSPCFWQAYQLLWRGATTPRGGPLPSSLASAISQR